MFFFRIIENANQKGQYLVFLPKGKELKGLQELGVTLRRLSEDQFRVLPSSGESEKKVPTFFFVVLIVLGAFVFYLLYTRSSW